MDRDKLSKTIAGILKMLVKATQQDRIDFDEDLAHEQILSILAPVFEKAEKWERVEELARYKGDCGYCKNDDLMLVNNSVLRVTVVFARMEMAIAREIMQDNEHFFRPVRKE
jgi:hypothetical protein